MTGNKSLCCKRKLIAPRIFLVFMVVFLFQGIIIAQEKYWVEPEEIPAIEQEYLQLIKPKPIDPALGPINHNGHLILYGQILEPPFQLVIERDTLYLNGVRVFPYIKPPWAYMTSPAEEPEWGELQMEVIEKVRAKFDQYESESKVDIHQALLEYIKSDVPDIDSAYWTGEGPGSRNLFITIEDSVRFSISLPPMKSPPINEAENLKRASLGLKNGISSSLSTDGLVVVGYRVRHHIPFLRAEATLERIEKAIKDNSRSSLEEVLIDGEPIQEILFYEERK